MAVSKTVRRFCAGSLAAAFALSFLPVWRVWSISSWEAVGDKGNLYTALSQLPRQAEYEGFVGAWRHYHIGNLIQLAAAVFVGGLLVMGVGGKLSRHR